jgi:hypothetical protein
VNLQSCRNRKAELDFSRVASLKTLMWRNILAVLTTQQILGFIQYKIAVTHAAGGDISTLLTNPEVAFSLQVLDGGYNNLTQAPAMALAANDNDYEAQQLVIVDANTKDGLDQVSISLF